MPISRDSQFIKEVGRRLGTTLTSDEINLLCLVCNESDTMRHAARGFFKHVTFDSGNETKPATFKIAMATKYLVLTTERIIAFDDKNIHFFKTNEITFYSLWAQASVRSTEIFCQTDDRNDFLILGLDDAAATKFSNKMNIYRDERDDDDEFTRAFNGMSFAKTLYYELATEGDFTMDEIYEMIGHPEQWGSGSPKNTPQK